MCMLVYILVYIVFFFFKQKTAYEMRISDWSSDVCSSDLDTQTVTTPFQDRFAFEIDPFRKMCLLEGLDEISLTEKSDTAIGAYEQKLDAERPWMRPAAAGL